VIAPCDVGAACREGMCAGCIGKSHALGIRALAVRSRVRRPDAILPRVSTSAIARLI